MGLQIWSRVHFSLSSGGFNSVMDSHERDQMVSFDRDQIFLSKSYPIFATSPSRARHMTFRLLVGLIWSHLKQRFPGLLRQVSRCPLICTPNQKSSLAQKTPKNVSSLAVRASDYASTSSSNPLATSLALIFSEPSSFNFSVNTHPVIIVSWPKSFTPSYTSYFFQFSISDRFAFSQACLSSGI